jgi:hypothetical protein
MQHARIRGESETMIEEWCGSDDSDPFAPTERTDSDGRSCLSVVQRRNN